MVRNENTDLINRLFNFKFEAALKYLEGEDEYVVDVVKALAETFGNCGWLDSNIGVIVYACVSKICPQIDEDD